MMRTRRPPRVFSNRSERWASALGLLLLSGCPDYLSGQDPEPEGPLLVDRLTLFDVASREHPVLTDTSIPDCSKAENKSSLTCSADTFGDQFGPHKSPPTPDSGREIRVVFNKVPLLYGNQQLEGVITDPATKMQRYILTKPDVVTLKCTGCTGAPPVVNTLIVTGSKTTSDPTYTTGGPAQIPYGPAILAAVTPDPTHSLAALEPDTAYTVDIAPELSGRKLGDKLQLTPTAMSRLTFKVEPYKTIRVGTGAGTDKWLANETTVDIGMIAANGAVAIRLNAPTHETGLATAVTATVGGMMAPSKTGVKRIVTGTTCVGGTQRVIYVMPASGTWGMAGAKLEVTVNGSGVSDVSQAAHAAGAAPAKGTHTLPGTLKVSATLGAVADAKYTGLIAGTDCPKPANL